MAEECVFCRIGKRSIPAYIIFEDTAVMAILDVNPLAVGHTLVIPKKHVERLEQLVLDDDLVLRIFKATRRATAAVQLGVEAPSTTIAIHNGKESGQEIPHLHVHIIPRKVGDGGHAVHAIMPDRPKVTKEQLEATREAIANQLR